MQKAAIVTGVNGGIGSSIAEFFLNKGYAVFGTDLHKSTHLKLSAYWPVDLDSLVRTVEMQEQFQTELGVALKKFQCELAGLINNAAIQILGDIETLKMSEFLLTQTVNVAAPLLMAKLCLPYMVTGKASIINIGSIHGSLTKPKFVSYATSKAAVRGLSKALAVDLQGRVRVNCIEPAAIATDMLLDGFKNHPDKLVDLEGCHPSGIIGKAEQVAELCYFLINSEIPFLNGACIGINGGIAARLHDPV